MPAETQKAIQTHTLLESLLYHLIPGLLIGAGYYILVPVVQRAGYPSVMALILTAVFILVPSVANGEDVIKVTISAGGVSYPKSGVASETELVEWADRALYLAKESGRNCVVMANSG